MESVARIHVAWELRQAGQKVDYIAEWVGVNRATAYRWLRGIRRWGFKEFVREYQQAKKGQSIKAYLDQLPKKYGPFLTVSCSYPLPRRLTTR